MGYGIGFNSGGIHPTKKDGKKTKIYHVWWSMMKRCGSVVYKEKHPNYKNVIVCEEWKDFQVFAEWCVHNYKIGFQLDKDIICKGCKIYSPETCSFVPEEVNGLFIRDENRRGLYPIGVSERGKRYSANISIKGKNISLGMYNTVEEAFNAYKRAKEELIKEMAIKWKAYLDVKVFDAMMNYVVDITY